MRHRPSRLRRLDDALAALPLEDPMLLTELDGFLTGIVLSPDAIPPAEWMQDIWGADDGGVPPFDDPLDVRWFADAVMARHTEIARDFGRGKPQPIFDIDERNGDIRWDLWIGGFALAMELRSANWARLAGHGDPDVTDAFARLSMLIAVARDEADLDSVQINALHDAAPAELTEALGRLHAALRADTAPLVPAAIAPGGKIGRNDACPCGSGRKSKRCCG